jgi:hypothetical protein
VREKEMTRATTLAATRILTSVRAEPVEALFFFLEPRNVKERQPFDKLRANG